MSHWISNAIVKVKKKQRVLKGESANRENSVKKGNYI